MNEPSRGRLLALPPAPDAVELRHLRAFVAVAEELNFGRAAARLYLSQPALSRQIRALERLLGAELLRRSTHRVELTLAGEALRPRAEDLLERLDDAVAATRAVGGELIGRAARHWDELREALGVEAGVQELRDAVEAMHAQFAVPAEVLVRPANAGGVPSLLLSGSPEQETTVLYLHGGGYILGSAFGYRPLVGAFALAAGTGVVLPDYRLAPEHPFPAAVQDALRAYAWIVERASSADRIVLAGDSTGGALVMSLLLSLAADGLPMPGGAVLLCPGLDLTGAYLDPVADAELVGHVRRSRELYLDGHPVDDPLVSPLLADLSGLPPLLVQAATGDKARPEARQLVERAREHGVDARFELYPADTHQFHVFWPFLPEAAEALQQAGAFVREVGERAGGSRSA
ncbi:alpha/beta hydrolase fold domain-containing protein [Pseudonocardia sp. DSM 110487]|uniref:alpha/beta hydrolase fold domain-containing protein n=1 Tax=Pseudonocardia sp. DSM 110487 TaxID=2865833 RepID=UPI001C694568|nr:alpha/beta hydrolase fold domain-containing protein [Pseudonocardia sp. DSM 110487]QYN36441.1 alpha/beta hydrolase fold domain-containing protein [Pseudonocardia sp. DSM 110487]